MNFCIFFLGVVEIGLVVVLMSYPSNPPDPICQKAC